MQHHKTNQQAWSAVFSSGSTMIYTYIYIYIHICIVVTVILRYICIFMVDLFVPGYIVEGFDPDTKDNTSSDRLQSHWNVFILRYLCTPQKAFAGIFSRWSEKNKTSCNSIKLPPATTFMLEQLRTQCCPKYPSNIQLMWIACWYLQSLSYTSLSIFGLRFPPPFPQILPRHVVGKMHRDVHTNFVRPPGQKWGSLCSFCCAWLFVEVYFVEEKLGCHKGWHYIFGFGDPDLSTFVTIATMGQSGKSPTQGFSTSDGDPWQPSRGSGDPGIHLWKMSIHDKHGYANVKMHHFPNFRGEHRKQIWNSHLVI